MKLPGNFIPNKKAGKRIEDLVNPKRKGDLEYASKHNIFKSNNETAQYFSDLWCEEAHSSDDKKADLVAEAYFAHILGFSKGTFEDFKENNSYAVWEEVGKRQGGIGRKEDCRAFWYEMKKIFPFDYPNEDIEFLVGFGIFPVSHLLTQFQVFSANHFFKLLEVNAHVHK